jgi:hypothetical protein
MSNALYTLARQSFLNGGINWGSADIRVALVDSTYTVNLATDQYVSTITAKIVARSSTLTSVTSTGGVANAANVTFSSVSGSAVNYIVIYANTGTDSTSQLIAYFDTATNLPITPNGGNITISFDTGANKIFVL